MRAAVVGAGGYAGIEAVRLLLAHPQFELTTVVSDSLAGQLVSSVYPALTGFTDLTFSHTDYQAIADQCDIVFLAVPHTAAMACAPEFLQRGVAVIDLSADYRIHDKSVYEKWYGAQHTSAQLLEQAVYGQPEKNRAQLQSLCDAWQRDDASTTPLVACAGCYPTASILASMPAVKSGFVKDGYVNIDAMSGVSGAGKKATDRTHYCHADESVQAYSAGKHRHTPEIAQELSELAGSKIDVVFTPHLVPMKRGLLSTVTMRICDGVDIEQLMQAYEQQYAQEFFVHFLGDQMPQTASVVGGNHAHVGISLEPVTRTLIASCAIDNLCKGAASQAVQCANIVCGLDERMGLDFVGQAV